MDAISDGRAAIVSQLQEECSTVSSGKMILPLENFSIFFDCSAAITNNQLFSFSCSRYVLCAMCYPAIYYVPIILVPAMCLFHSLFIFDIFGSMSDAWAPLLLISFSGSIIALAITNNYVQRRVKTTLDLARKYAKLSKDTMEKMENDRDDLMVNRMRKFVENSFRKSRKTKGVTKSDQLPDNCDNEVELVCNHKNGEVVSINL
jgi:hypothetical protein